MAFYHFTGNNGDPLPAGLTAQNGTFEIEANRCVASGSEPSGAKWIATSDGDADTVISMLFRPNNGGGTAGLLGRYSDNDNMLWALVGPSGQCNLFTRIAGVNTVIGSTGNIPSWNGTSGVYLLSLEMNGSSLNFKVDGVSRCTATTTHNQTAIKHGIRAVNTVAQFDSLAVRSSEVMFACYGQSNMSGVGTNSQTYAASAGGLRATLFGNDYVFKNLADPYDSDLNQVDLISADGSAAGSWMLRFANDWLANSEVPVGFIPCAQSGKTIARLSKLDSTRIDGLNLYESMVKRASAIGGVNEVLYEQGEADANDSNGTTLIDYEASLNLLVNNIKADLGVDTFIIPLHTITAAGYDGNGATTGQDAIRQAQLNVAASNANCRIGQSLADIDISAGDGLHFQTDTELNTVGVRMYSSWSAIPPVISTLNFTVTGLTSTTRDVKFFDWANEAYLKTETVNFDGSGFATTSLSVPVSTVIFAGYLGNNPPITGTGIYGVTE